MGGVGHGRGFRAYQVKRFSLSGLVYQFNRFSFVKLNL